MDGMRVTGCLIVDGAASGCEITAAKGHAVGGVRVTGLPRPAAELLTTTLRRALHALGMSAPSPGVLIHLADADRATVEQVALPAGVALLAAIGVLPAAIDGRFAAFGRLTPDGGIGALAGGAAAAALAARRRLGWICAEEQAGCGADAGCADVVASGDLMALINHLRGAQQPSRPFPVRPAGETAFHEAAPAGFQRVAPAETPATARVDLLWRELMQDRAPSVPVPSERRAAPAPEAPSAAERSEDEALPFPDTGPTGHRSRLRDKVLARGTDALADYELLEMLLFFAFRTGDTKPLAKRLINRYGSFARVLAAPQQELLATPGLGPHSVVALQLVQAAAVRMTRADLQAQPLLGNWPRLLEYLTMVLSRERNEQFRALFLDTRNRLIADEVQSRGTVNQVPAYPREIVKRALELHASAIILVHNHPSGDATPSLDDIDLTREVCRAAGSLGIQVHDHVIIGRGEPTSMRQSGLMP